MFGLFKNKKSTDVEVHKAKKRSFSAGTINRLTADWSTDSSTPNSDVYADLNKLRSRSRGLVQNNGYAKKYIGLVTANVVGKNGIQLQAMSKDANDKYDTMANDQIEAAWMKWSKQCDVTGTMSWVDFQTQAIGATAQDGEVIIRMVKSYDNDFGFALQMIEADQLDVNLNDERRNIVMGIELNAFGRPVAYHITKGHPSSNMYRSEHVRIPAEEIIHLYRPLRVGQVRGVPWMHSSMSALNMLDRYEEAELTAARVAAGKMGFYKTPTGNEYSTGITEDNDVIMEVEPGTFEEMPAGWEFQTFDPTHPTSAYEAFTKNVLRSVASGLGVSYESLSNNRSDVNYSSIRQGALEERDNWRVLQTWLSERLSDRVYKEWLPLAMLTGELNLPLSKTAKFEDVTWIGRGFQWIDPSKDAQANILLAKEGLKSHKEIVGEQGKNIADVYAQIAKEKDAREKLGIVTSSDAGILETLQGVENEN